MSFDEPYLTFEGHKVGGSLEQWYKCIFNSLDRPIINYYDIKMMKKTVRKDRFRGKSLIFKLIMIWTVKKYR